MRAQDLNLAIVGLGYVGLPLAVAFGKKRSVVGFDINETRIAELKLGRDVTLETTQKELNDARFVHFSADPAHLKSANCFIVTVPTPIDAHKRPDLKPLIEASEIIGGALKKGDIKPLWEGKILSALRNCLQLVLKVFFSGIIRFAFAPQPKTLLASNLHLIFKVQK
jgi:UDP-N-acetyl-D-mannosaminuronate dehydrogenase